VLAASLAAVVIAASPARADAAKATGIEPPGAEAAAEVFDPELADCTRRRLVREQKSPG
jgi:hypothetical protein